MPAKISILYPSAAMALLTIALIFGLGIRRFAAVRRRQVNPKFYRTFRDSEGSEPEALRRHWRHVQNHFEVPPLFHFAVFGTCLFGEVTAATLAAAWFFVGTRVVHAAIHLTYNNVLHRFCVFGLGLIAVALLWLRLLLTLHGPLPS